METLNVLVSLVTENNDYQRAQEAAARAAAAKLGAHVEVIFANNDAVHQTQQILQYVQKSDKRPDAIIVEPVGTGMFQVAKAAVNKGIAWVLANSGADYLAQLRGPAQVPVFAVVSDHVEIGKIQGRQIAALLGDHGTVLYLEGPGVRDVARLRTKGMMSTKPGTVAIKSLKGDWTQKSGYHAIKSWLALSTSREMNIGMIACQNDDMANGARQAFEEIADSKERDAWLALPITGCDGVAISGQTWVRQGRLAATVVSPPVTGDALHMLASARASHSQPPEITLLAPSSFPVLTELKRVHATAAGQTL
ncbi:MAG TPA: substrate-binding domain-containing protein [Candidatus Sulfotelmatobacter sp.]|nr:substrate-binding domain-containing protein [Candidatus Sulfotelmatobacter sp.]